MLSCTYDFWAFRHNVTLKGTGDRSAEGKASIAPGGVREPLLPTKNGKNQLQASNWISPNMRNASTGTTTSAFYLKRISLASGHAVELTFDST